MSLLQSVRLLRTHAPRLITTSRQTRLATQGYGSGDGDPRGENPLEQGKNPSEGLEHPGPPPPSIENKGQQKQQQPSKEQDSGKGSSSSTQGAPQPKILAASPPPDEDAPPDVRKHNEEMNHRGSKLSG